MWHHEHIIEPIDNDVLMTDIISYQPPFGFLGAIVNRLLIKKKLKEILTTAPRQWRKFLEDIITLLVKHHRHYQHQNVFKLIFFFGR